MLVLALDTTTRAGSIALLRDREILDVAAGDPARTHGVRLPGDLERLIARQGRTLREIGGYAVAAGPGPFTGLRVGIATVQGLAFATGRPVVAIGTLEAVAYAATRDSPAIVPGDLVLACTDAHRREVFGAVFEHVGADVAPRELDSPVVGLPGDVMGGWTGRVAGRRCWVAGSAAPVVAATTAAQAIGAALVRPVDVLAPAVGVLAVLRLEAGGGGPPHAVRPLYVRRPDAEIARDRRTRQAPAGPVPP